LKRKYKYPWMAVELFESIDVICSSNNPFTDQPGTDIDDTEDDDGLNGDG